MKVKFNGLDQQVDKVFGNVSDVCLDLIEKISREY